MKSSQSLRLVSALLLTSAALAACGSEGAPGMDATGGAGAPAPAAGGTGATSGADDVGSLPHSPAAALFAPREFSLYTDTPYPPMVEQDDGGPAPFGENYMILSALFRNGSEERTLRLGILAGSRVDMRVRDDDSVVVTDLLVRLQDVHFPRSRAVPNGLYLGNIMLQAPSALVGRVVKRTETQVDLSVLLDFDVTMSVGMTASSLVELPAIAVRDFPLFVTLQKDGEAGGVLMAEVRASGAKGAALIDIPNILTIQEASIDMSARSAVKR